MTTTNNKYHLLIYGCQMNVADSEVLAGMLTTLGYEETPNLDKASLILLITCAVRDTAEQKIYGKLGQLSRLKANNPDLILGICGCMPQQPHVAKKFKEHFPALDMVFGTHNLHQFPKLLQEAIQGEQSFDIWPDEGEIVEGLPKHRQATIKGWVNITYGCNNFCTYCIVPYVRGRERSRKPQDILAEIKELIATGYKDITLLGQNVNSYGKDFDTHYDFSDLLTSINQMNMEFRLRFTTSHPRDMTDKLIGTIASAKVVCEHIHLPLQAGSNDVLRRMNRGYTREHYLGIVDKIRTAMPNCSITTDLIVGFPGETEADFQLTLDAVHRVGYDAAFTFAYSPREGTVAATMTTQVDDKVKKQRLYSLIESVNKEALKRNQQLLGSTQQVLVEGPSKKDTKVLTGRTRTNKLVHLRGNHQPGDLVDVHITESRTFLLWGETL